MINVKLIKEHTHDLSVLYVEDDKSLMEDTSELLENYFKKVDTAYNGQDGLDKYISYEKENGEFYDLIISDINMPKLNGIAMSEKILLINHEQFIIITTAYNEVEFLSSALDLGIDGYVTKPIENEKLMKVLYKVAHAITNNKFVESHIHVVEDLNIRLDEQNKELISKNIELLAKNNELEKSFRMLDTMVHKEQLVQPKKMLEKLEKKPNVDEYFKEQMEHLIEDDLFELVELHTEIDLIVINLINSTDSVDIFSIKELSKKFNKYASILSIYHFFDKLGASMKNFARTIKDNQIPENEETFKNIMMLVESFIYVLGKWQSELSEGDANNINSLDASMISDMETIVNMWTQVEEKFLEEDMDNIFDF